MEDGAAVDRLVEQLLKSRVFADKGAKMTRSLQEIAGVLILVPQFTPAAELVKGYDRDF